MQLSCVEIENAVKKAVIEHFPKERIVCLLRYGPATTLTGKQPADFDFLLLLDTFDAKDCSSIQLLNLPIEIFFDYKSHIELRGIHNYKRGCHGTYFIHILASAQLLLGENYYATIATKLSEEKEHMDLLDRIEEYFYRIQKLLLNDTHGGIKCTPKYLARITTDILLLNGDLTYEQMHQLHYSDILQNTITETDVFPEEQKDLLTMYFTQPFPTPRSSSDIIDVLHRAFTILLIRHHEKYSHNY